MSASTPDSNPSLTDLAARVAALVLSPRDAALACLKALDDDDLNVDGRRRYDYRAGAATFAILDLADATREQTDSVS